MTTTPIHLGDWLCMRRTAASLDREGLAARAREEAARAGVEVGGIDRSALWLWENGRRCPNAQQLACICGALGLSREDHGIALELARRFTPMERRDADLACLREKE